MSFSNNCLICKIKRCNVTRAEKDRSDILFQRYQTHLMHFDFFPLINLLVIVATSVHTISEESFKNGIK